MAKNDWAEDINPWARPDGYVQDSRAAGIEEMTKRYLIENTMILVIKNTDGQVIAKAPEGMAVGTKLTFGYRVVDDPINGARDGALVNEQEGFVSDDEFVEPSVLPSAKQINPKWSESRGMDPEVLIYQD